MRLATFEIIESIRDIEGRDIIGVATILGYEVVIKKHEFKVGDWCVLIPIDTIIDISNPWFSFLKPDKGKTTLRIKTIKLGGEYSQGLVVPLSNFTNIPNPDHLTIEELDSIDLGELLGVTKYEKEIETPSPSGIFVPFPIKYIPITDEDNLKTKKKILNELIDKEVLITMKMDGSSMTLIWDEELFICSSRRISLISYLGEDIQYEYESAMVNYVKNNNLRNLFRGRKIILQGEFCGPKINGNKMKLTEFHYYIFTIYENEQYYKYFDMYNLCNSNGLEIVPLIGELYVTEETTINDFQLIADDVKYGDDKGEGIVVRPLIPYRSNVLNKNSSFKVINRMYKD